MQDQSSIGSKKRSLQGFYTTETCYSYLTRRQLCVGTVFSQNIKSVINIFVSVAPHLGHSAGYEVYCFKVDYYISMELEGVLT